MKNKMYIININEKGKIERIEDCTLNDFGRDYIIATSESNTEIEETRNGNVYFKYIDSANYKIFMIDLYVIKTIKMEELREDIEEINTELKYRNED